MNRQAKQLALRLREVFLDGKWIANTNYRELLGDVTLDEANYRVEDLNTIALLTFHINYYVEGVMQVLKGGDLTIRDKYSFDMPILKSEEEWENLRSSLSENAERFAALVERMSDEELAASFVKAEYGDYQRNIEGIIEHSYYHFGQLSLIKKLVRKR